MSKLFIVLVILALFLAGAKRLAKLFRKRKEHIKALRRQKNREQWEQEHAEEEKYTDWVCLQTWTVTEVSRATYSTEVLESKRLSYCNYKNGKELSVKIEAANEEHNISIHMGDNNEFRHWWSMKPGQNIRFVRQKGSSSDLFAPGTPCRPDLYH